MVAYSFKRQFAPLVVAGQKQQTIRAIGKRRHARPGEAIQLYTGMRTDQCRKLVTPDPICNLTQNIKIEPRFSIGLPAGYDVYLDNVLLDYASVCILASADGFDSVSDFLEFFKNRMPFEGVVIHWTMPTVFVESES